MLRGVMTRGILVSLVFALLAPAGARAATKTAVLVVGGEPADAGAMQTLLDARLSRVRGIAALSASEVAFLVGSDEGRIARESRGEAEDLLQAARRATAEDRLADALESLAELEALQDRSRGVPVADRVALRSWRVSIFLSLEDRDRAAQEARQLLALSPYVQVDTSVFRPSVASLVDEVRSAGLPDATVHVEGLPPKAKVVVDERPAGQKFEVITGRHWVTISAPRFRSVERAIDVLANQTLTAELAPSFDQATRDVLGAAVGARPWERSDRASLEKLAQRLGVDALVIATVDDPARAALWWKGAEVPLECPALPSRSAIGDWAVARLVEGARGPHPSAVATGAARIGAWLEGMDAEVAGVGGIRRSTLDGAATARFTRAGARGSVTTLREGWVVQAGGSLVSDGWRRSRVRGPRVAGPVAVRARGGVSSTAALAAGRRAWVGNGESSVLALDALAGAQWERREAGDPFPSWAAIAPFASVTARVPLVLYGESFVAIAGIRGSPWAWTSFDGSPWRTESGVEVGLDWRPREGWLVGARWEQARTIVRMKPAELEERASGISLTFRRSF